MALTLAAAAAYFFAVAAASICLRRASAFLSTASFLASYFGFGGRGFGTSFFLTIPGSGGSGNPYALAFFHAASLFLNTAFLAFWSALYLATAAFLAATLFFFASAFLLA